ncbi:hypothetical protein GCM10027052_04230 [Parafrigoribacterium mesophilum]|uniref:hypothetical protein n=1 Tax=Parafrigoribacterium mesophilum TaxID=433646 RepID=UPI0031FC7CB4
MRNPFRRAAAPAGYPKSDAGSGSLDQYAFNLVPKNGRVKVQLAGSDPYQEELARVRNTGADSIEVFFADRTVEEERTDAAMPARIFTSSRMSGIVGYVPRGLEPVILEAMARLASAGRSTRIPAEIADTKRGLRVTLLMGATR